jgi:acyl-CoA synthetase (AMP-forming)/AMP-acid ligase II
MSEATQYNFADLFEAMADEVPERTAVVVGEQRRTFAELEERANRLAHHLESAGVQPGQHVGIYAYNSVEWVEAMFALHKIRAVPVNVNYRYVEGELRYLFENADLVAVVVQQEFVPRVAGIISQLPLLRHVVVIDDGNTADLDALAVDGLTADGRTVTEFEAALAAASPSREFAERSPDDIHIIYTGGTTGMPKGVMWRQEDIFFALAGGIDAYSNEKVQSPTELVRRVRDGAAPVTLFTAAPLMHGAGQVATIRSAISGDTVVLMPKFDAEEAWRTVAREKTNTLMITGDAMARPLADALVELEDELDLSSLLAVSSSAAIFSQSIKDQFMDLMPNLIVVDSIGATETGMNGIKVAQHHEQSHGGPATVQPSRDSIVVDDDLKPLEPGSDQIGRVARTGNIPLGYYKDPERTAQVFFERDGVRYSVPGDFAKVEADGQVTLLGRGSIVINTGGEKVFPEEVEGVLKAHPDVFDVLVVGVPDDRWGERVTAVVQPRTGRELTVDGLVAHCRTHIAAYKAPKQLFVVDEIVRAPSGKPDYPWAKQYARDRADG